MFVYLCIFSSEMCQKERSKIGCVSLSNLTSRCLSFLFLVSINNSAKKDLFSLAGVRPLSLTTHSGQTEPRCYGFFVLFCLFVGWLVITIVLTINEFYK